MLVYHYGNCGCAELRFLFSQHCLLSHLLGRFPELCAFPIEACSRKGAREGCSRTNFHLVHKGIVLAASDCRCEAGR